MMISEDARKLCELLVKNEYWSLNEIFERMYSIRSIVGVCKPAEGICEYWKIIDDENDAINKVNSIILLIGEIDFVRSESSNGCTPGDYCNNDKTPTENLNKLINSFSTNRFHINRIGLKKYICNGFMTNEEREYIAEKKSRERAEMRTTILAYISILTTLFGILFNYLTYTTKRQVEIVDKNGNPTCIVLQLSDEQISKIIIGNNLGQ